MSTSVTRVGSETFPPLPETAEVLVFSNDGEIRTTYIPLGIVHHNAEGVMTSYTLDDVMGALKSKAPEIGANALIIDQTIPMGAYGRGLNVRARAVRIPDKLRQAQ
jgi:hypothetical protein